MDDLLQEIPCELLKTASPQRMSQIGFQRQALEELIAVSASINPWPL
jgi:hypothetical protein